MFQDVTSLGHPVGPADLSYPACTLTSFKANRKPPTLSVSVEKKSFKQADLILSEFLAHFGTRLRLVDLHVAALHTWHEYNIHCGDKEGVTNGRFCFLSACFLSTSLTSSASGSPGKHDLYDVGGYCISTPVCHSVSILLRSVRLKSADWIMYPGCTSSCCSVSGYSIEDKSNRLHGKN